MRLDGSNVKYYFSRYKCNALSQPQLNGSLCSVFLGVFSPHLEYIRLFATWLGLLVLLKSENSFKHLVFYAYLLKELYQNQNK